MRSRLMLALRSAHLPGRFQPQAQAASRRFAALLPRDHVCDGAEDEVADRRADSVGCNDDVDVPRRAVTVRDTDHAGVLHEGRDRGREAQWYVGDSFQEHSMQLASGDPQARTNRTPDAREIDVREMPTGMIEDSLV